MTVKEAEVSSNTGIVSMTVEPVVVKVAKVPKVVVIKEVRAPSKKSGALEIFKSKMSDRANKLYGSNKEFRAAVLKEIEVKLEVSTASAATMYNAAKKEAEAADPTVGLGRDPKKEKVKTTSGVRGRPVGSKNKAKEDEAPAVVVAKETADAPF
jgi:hypothetical protein